MSPTAGGGPAGVEIDRRGAGRERLEVEEPREDADGGDPIGERVMDLGDDRGPAVRELLDDVELPQRATPVERFLGDPGRQLLEVGDAGVRREVGEVEVQIEVDVRVGPAWPDAERIANDDLVEGLDVVEAGGDETAHAVDRERLRSGRRVEDEDTEYVPGHGRRLGQEETSVEPGDRISHRSTVLLPGDPTPPAIYATPRRFFRGADRGTESIVRDCHRVLLAAIGSGW